MFVKPNESKYILDILHHYISTDDSYITFSHCAPVFSLSELGLLLFNLPRDYPRCHVACCCPYRDSTVTLLRSNIIARNGIGDGDGAWAIVWRFMTMPGGGAGLDLNLLVGLAWSDRSHWCGIGGASR